jgi:sulfur carrier protein
MSRTATTGVAREIAVMVNDEPRTCEAGATAADLVAALGLGARPIAVEINREVVPRARLAGHRLADGDRLEIVTLVGGG